MRAVRNTTDGITVVDVLEPEGEGVIVTPTAVGICGSDLHVIDMGPRDVTIGHEIGGVLDGRPVAIQPFAFCGECDECLTGRSHICSTNFMNIYGIACDGGLADQVLVDPRCIVELPEGVGADVACLVEPIAVGVHAVNLADLEPGMRVAVVGAGPIGLVTGAAARAKGVDVDIATRHDHQSIAAERLGLQVGVTDGYDVVLDAAGNDSSLDQALSLVRGCGTVVFPGIFWGEATVPGLKWWFKEARMVPSTYYGHHHGTREVELAADLLADVPELADALITHRMPLDQAADAFATAADRAAGAIKVVIEA